MRQRQGTATTWGTLAGKPSTFPSSAHSHVTGDITGLAAVAATGSYNDLSNKPSIPAAQVNSDWNAGSGVAQILNKPSIPAAQVNSDWNASSGVAQILNKPTRSFNNTPGRSLVSVAAAANGFQVSSTRDAIVNYSVTITTAGQIGVVTNVDGYVALEIAATNSSTAGDWAEIGRAPSAQQIGLAIALSLNQKGGGQVGGVVPAGYFARLRTVTAAGTPTYTYNSGQEVLI